MSALCAGAGTAEEPPTPARITADARSSAEAAGWQGGCVSVPGLVVVAGAILDGAGRVLVAQRARPAELAGRWEFPGGKIEPGESDAAALIREMREELGVDVVPEALQAEVPLPAGRRLRLWTARLAGGTPQPLEHAELRWVTAAELPRLDWLEPDRPLLAPLAERLRADADQGQR